jgi:chromosome segregation ATPase
MSNIENAIQTNQNVYDIEATDCSNKQKMLIDKRDELALITEQFNRHEWVMKRGEVRLREREEEHKILIFQLNDFQRQIEIMHRKLPQLRAYEKEIAELERQIKREQTDVDALTAKLEAPNLQERERAYCGRDFSLSELEEKVSLYEQRINGKQQQLWEKTILLKEIVEKIAEVTHQSGTDNPETLKLFEKSGALRAENMTLRRRKMAAMAETSIYMSQMTKLEEEKEVVKEEIVKAAERVEQGKPFDGYAGKMIKMHERDWAAKGRNQSRPDSWDSGEDEEEERQSPGRKRYDAYRTSDGLSRPYGAFPVFQPGSPSGQLRHYKKETLRPIEL